MWSWKSHSIRPHALVMSHAKVAYASGHSWSCGAKLNPLTPRHFWNMNWTFRTYIISKFWIMIIRCGVTIWVDSGSLLSWKVTLLGTHTNWFEQGHGPRCSINEPYGGTLVSQVNQSLLNDWFCDCKWSKIKINVKHHSMYKSLRWSQRHFDCLRLTILDVDTCFKV